MKNKIISLLLLASAVWALPALAQNLRADAPDRYTVQRGDTLWGISGRYLDNPWNWPQLWNMNKDQVRNPHWIYPGNVLVLDRTTGRLRVEGNTVRLTPGIRSEAIVQSIPTIPPAVINAFLSKPLVVSETELDSAPRIMATEESRMALGAGSVAYVKNLPKGPNEFWQIFRRGDKLVDPETGETLGYLAIYLGDAKLRKHGEVSSIDIIKSAQEIYTDDRLLAAPKDVAHYSFTPRAPDGKVSGRVISMYDNLFETGKFFIVSLSKGSKDGVEVGHVLGLHRSQNTSRYDGRTEAMYGRSGLSGNDGRRLYYEERLTPRDAPLYQHSVPVNDTDLAKIPDERYGLVMVFRTFDRASFGLVMEAKRPVAVSDIVTNP